MTQTQEHNVPALRFTEFSGEWKPTTLGRESVCLDNKRIPLKEGDRSKRRGAYPYYGASGIIDTIDDYLFDETLVLLAEDGANIIMRNSPIAFLAKGKFWVNNHAHVYRAKGSPLFLATYLENLRYDKYNTGTAQPKLNGETCKKLKLNFPTLPEQQKIAAFLSSVDRKIAQFGRKKALLQRYKKGMMQKLFSQELRFKDAQGHDFPDWEEKRLGDLYEFKSTNSFSRDKLNYDEGNVRNIHYGDIHTKFKPAFDLQKESVPLINSDMDLSRIAEDKYCQKGDLVIADASEDYDDIGKTIELINLNNEKVLAGLHTLLARLVSRDIHVGFGTFVMACAAVRKQIKLIAQGTKVLGISTGRMEQVKLPIPCPEEQQIIANFLSAIDLKIGLVATELDQAKALKKGLLQQMFV